MAVPEDKQKKCASLSLFREAALGTLLHPSCVYYLRGKRILAIPAGTFTSINDVREIRLQVPFPVDKLSSSPTNGRTFGTGARCSGKGRVIYP